MPRPEPRLPPQKKQKKAESTTKNPSSPSNDAEIPTPSRQKKIGRERSNSVNCEERER